MNNTLNRAELTDSDALVFLDLFSTSQTDLCYFDPFSSETDQPQCIYNTPYFAYRLSDKQYGIARGCCNHWDCPRCGQLRARENYGRIVEGVRQFAKYELIWFYTITCRGRHLSRQDALDGYLTWTNNFLTAFRAITKRRKFIWSYVQVTELQKRGHPHSHILSTAPPPDVYESISRKWEIGADGKRRYLKVSKLQSRWFDEIMRSSGLGEQYDISLVNTAEGASRYVAKYLFKDTIFTSTWPKNWKRIRYSQNFPKLPDRNNHAFVLLSETDWYNLSRVASVVRTPDDETWFTASHFLTRHGVSVK